MQAITVTPGRAGSARLQDVPPPRLEAVPEGRGVLVKVLRVGVDATDREINEARYGEAPAGSSYLILGHESFGRVEAVGPHVHELAVGDYVVAVVRRPGDSLYDQMGMPDLTSDERYWEHGISRCHGFLAEYYAESADYLVRVPPPLKDVAVLLEPLSIVVKALEQAEAVQRRLGVWRPRRAAVMGVGTIGLLMTLLLRLRGLEVATFARSGPDTPRAQRAIALGARYYSTGDSGLCGAAEAPAPFDLIVEATGAAPVAFDSMRLLSKNGVLVLTSVTGGDRTLEVPADRINLDFVLGNRAMVGSVNANRTHFEAGLREMAAAQTVYPGWLASLLTTPIHGLERYQELFKALEDGHQAIKVYVEVAEA